MKRLSVSLARKVVRLISGKKDTRRGCKSWTSRSAEVLEHRALLSAATVNTDTSTLTVSLDGAEKSVTIAGELEANQISVTVDGNPIGSYALSGISAIEVYGNAEDNIVDLSGIPQFAIDSVLVETYGGNDIVTGSMSEDVILAGSGDDTVFAGGGMDYVSGGDGADLLGGNSSGDSLDGGSGNDSLYGQQGFDSLNGGDGDDSISGGDQDLPPVFESIIFFEIDDYASNGTVVGTVQASDPEGLPLTFALSDPTGTFAIDNSGVITLVDNSNIGGDDDSDYEFPVEITISDGTTDVTEPGMILATGSFSITKPTDGDTIQETSDIVFEAKRRKRSKVRARLEKLKDGTVDQYIKIDEKDFLASANNYSQTVSHNFGKQSPGNYRIIYYWVATSGPKEKGQVSIEVVTP